MKTPKKSSDYVYKRYLLANPASPASPPVTIVSLPKLKHMTTRKTGGQNSCPHDI